MTRRSRTGTFAEKMYEFVNSDNSGGYAPPTDKGLSPVKKILMTGAAVVIGMGVWLSYYTVDQGERGIVLRYGKIVSVAEPGLNFKIPYVDSVAYIPIHNILLRYKGVETYSKDQQPAHIQVSITWRPLISADALTTLYTQYRDLKGIEERIIAPKIFEELKTVFGQFNAETAIQERDRLNNNVREALRKNAVGPFEIVNVSIENIEFSSTYVKSIEERMMAEVEVAKLRQNAEREKVSAQITVTKATAEADALRAQAQAEAEAIRLRGNAEAEAIAIRGKALKESPDIVALTAAQRWDGKLPDTMVPNASLPFLNLK